MILLQPFSFPNDLAHLITASGDLLGRLILDVLAVGVLIRLIYYRIYRRSDLFLMFFTFNLVIFLITYLLNQVQLSIGAAFGLFAVFSMLRYRTESISAKDMTYLFLVISIGLLSAINQGGLPILVGIDVLLLASVQLLESNYLFRREISKSILYDRIDHIRPADRLALLADLRLRLGLYVHRVDIQHIDFRKELVQMIVYYYPDATASAYIVESAAPPLADEDINLDLSATNPV